MGNGTVTAAVADAGPLIHLTQIGSLSLLEIFETIHIPDVVLAETIGRGRLLESDLSNLGNVQRQALPQSSLTQFIEQNGLQQLQAGECGCLYLCQQTQVSTFLTDDLAAREAAKIMGVTPVGSLGVVVKAYKLGVILLVDAERVLNDLYEVISLFVTRVIVDLAIGQLRQQAKQN